jgi:hypothetical protein
MLWIVLPPAVGGKSRGAIAATNICIAIKVVVAINVDVVAAPPAVPAIPPAPERSHRHADTERDGHPCGVIPWRRIVDGGIRIHRRTVHDGGVVGRHIHDLWARRLDYDYTLVIDRLLFDLLLLSRLQIALGLGLLAHALYGRHHIALLREKSIPQVGCPLNIVGEPFRDIWNSRKRLNAWVPRLLGHCVG